MTAEDKKRRAKSRLTDSENIGGKQLASLEGIEVKKMHDISKNECAKESKNCPLS